MPSLVIDVGRFRPRSNLLGSRKRKQRFPYLDQRKKRHSAEQRYKDSDSGFQACLLSGLALRDAMPILSRRS